MDYLWKKLRPGKVALRVEKVDLFKSSEWGLPGVENVPTPLDTIFNISRGPQRPYIEKNKKSEHLLF